MSAMRKYKSVNRSVVPVLLAFVLVFPAVRTAAGATDAEVNTAAVFSGKPVPEYEAGIPDESIRATAVYVLAHLNDPDVVIVDVRSREEYTGERNDEDNKRTGHIPGAVNLNYLRTNFNADTGTLKPVSELRNIYASNGVTKDKEIIVYCQGGIRAANTFFVLKYLLEYPRVRNYIGSWGEWGNRVDFEKYPVEK